MQDGGRLSAEEQRRFDEVAEAFERPPYERDPASEAHIQAALAAQNRRTFLDWWRRRG